MAYLQAAGAYSPVSVFDIITLIIILIIIWIILLIISLVKKANAPEKKPEGYYENHPETKGTYVFHCKSLNSMESLLNLGQESSGLEHFSYNDRHLFIRMKNGRTLEGNIDDMSAEFSTYKDYIECTVKCNNDEICICSIWHLFTDEEWWTIFNILSHCGTTYNLRGYLETHQLYTTKEGKVTRGLVSAANILRHFI